jgi:bla regulator protein BlaR1
MRILETITVSLVIVATAHVFGQTAASPTFDVVSIKRNTVLAPQRVNIRPDGGFALTNIVVPMLISQAYPPVIPADMTGLPDWAMRERYDVSATSSLTSATPEQRIAMMRAMLADRFRLVAHVENREQPAYDLVVSRSDGRLGQGIKPTDVDCNARAKAPLTPEERANAQKGIPPPCTLVFKGDRMEGDTTMAALAQQFRSAAGRLVVDKTGLTGSYHVTMTYDYAAGFRPLGVPPPADASESVFAAVEDQLGLKLQPSRVLRETLVIDRLERPTEN